MSPRSPRSAHSSLRRLALNKGGTAREGGGKLEDLARMVQEVKTQSDSLACVFRLEQLSCFDTHESFRKIEEESFDKLTSEGGTESSLGQSVTALNRIIDRLELEAVDTIKVYYARFLYKRLSIDGLIFPCFSKITLYRYFSLGNTIHALSGTERACRGRKSQIRLFGHQTEDRRHLSSVTSGRGIALSGQPALSCPI